MELEIDAVLEQVNGHDFWLSYLSDAKQKTNGIGVHIAICTEPYLSMMLSGEKTIESRFSRNRCAPYGEIHDGDIILLKEVAGPICGIALAKQTWCYDLLVEPIDRIRYRFGRGICANDEFWKSQADAHYVTLIELDSATAIAPIICDKKDRRGWVSLDSRQIRLNFR